MDMNLSAEIPAAKRLATVSAMQAIEKAADAAGHSYAAMMESAGRQVADAVLARYGVAPVLVLAGPGNNGGDGLVCARYLHQAGAPVRVYLWQRRTEPADDYEGHLGRLEALGVPWLHANADPELALLRSWLQRVEGEPLVLVDALLGTGANRPITGQLATLLTVVRQAQNAGRVQVVAVDCASGLNCDDGAVSPFTLAPALTVTFAHAKYGHYLFPGADYVGELAVADIGVPPALSAELRTFVLDAELVASWLPARPRNSHKGAFGKLLLAVGSEQFPGAASLSCGAAVRTGAGLVTGAVPRTIWPIAAARAAEPTWLPLAAAAEEPFAVFDPAGAAMIAAKLPAYDALVLGCGLGNTPATRQFVDALLGESLPPTLIDADGLNCLAQFPDWATRLPAIAVLTPHPAELARLTGRTLAEVMTQRWAVAAAVAQAGRCVVLAKGPYTVVAAPDGWLAVLPIATPALATAGTGDVLAGVIGALLAQGLEPFRAACVGAWLHGEAGLRCEQAIGRTGVAASDLLPQLPVVIEQLRRQHVGRIGAPLRPPSHGEVADPGIVAM